MNRDIVWTNQFKNAKRTAPLSHDRESGAVVLRNQAIILVFSSISEKTLSYTSFETV